MGMVSLFNLLELSEIHRFTQLVEVCDWDEDSAHRLIQDISDICENLPTNPDEILYELQVELDKLGWSEEVYTSVADIFNEITDEYKKLIAGDDLW